MKHAQKKITSYYVSLALLGAVAFTGYHIITFAVKIALAVLFNEHGIYLR